MHAPTKVDEMVAPTLSPARGVGSELSDDRGVGQDEQRLGHERREGRECQGEDLAVEGHSAAPICEGHPRDETLPFLGAQPVACPGAQAVHGCRNVARPSGGCAVA